MAEKLTKSEWSIDQIYGVQLHMTLVLRRRADRLTRDLAQLITRITNGELIKTLCFPLFRI